ncbi:MAG: hypothetical protein QOG47_1631 [Mycobacterium sp.]|jgi:hypothetical protein|nr:hypothetical protein [Mycobacterium sp.]MDT5088924.1 hypothetical protein [Mycobacterium sp.]
MSADEKEATSEKEETADKQQQGENETPELSEEGKKQVEQMQQAYNDDRETAVLPGTDGTITGVAINEWLDDDGNPKFGQDKKQEDGDTQQDDATHEDDATKQNDADAQQDAKQQDAD